MTPVLESQENFCGEKQENVKMVLGIGPQRGNEEIKRVGNWARFYILLQQPEAIYRHSMLALPVAFEPCG